MNKYLVTVEFVIKAQDRSEAWKKSREVCRNHLRDLASVREITNLPLPDPQEWIAINEPIKATPRQQLVAEIKKVRG